MALNQRVLCPYIFRDGLFRYQRYWFRASS
uniref:Uncharacterized protein n=1 Tax=Anguilla anguilla TaxID=7936 RepID=A0A0E9Q612_ANGAN